MRKKCYKGRNRKNIAGSMKVKKKRPEEGLKEKEQQCAECRNAVKINKEGDWKVKINNNDEMARNKDKENS